MKNFYVEISSNPLSRDGRSYLLNKWRPALCYTYYMDLNALNYLVRDTLNVAQNKHGFRDFSVHESVEAIFSRSARSRQFPSLLLPRFSLNLWFQTVAKMERVFLRTFPPRAHGASFASSVRDGPVTPSPESRYKSSSTRWPHARTDADADDARWKWNCSLPGFLVQ